MANIDTSQHGQRGQPAASKLSFRYQTVAMVLVAIYIALHYLILVSQSTYGPSFIDELACLLLLPFAVLAFIHAGLKVATIGLIGYWICLIVGMILGPDQGVPQPLSALVAAALDTKVAVMAFAFVWLFKRLDRPEAVFNVIFFTFIAIAIIDLPFVGLDYLRGGSSLRGAHLVVKAGLVQPMGLFGNHTETSWLFTIAAFSSAVLYKARRKMHYLLLCALFTGVVFAVLSIKEMFACIIGLIVLLRPPKAGFFSLLFSLSGVGGAIFLFLIYTPIGNSLLEHMSMFTGMSRIETVRSGMFDASIKIAATHFPLGTGGGTFGSAPSYQYGYSYVYYTYGLNTLYGGSRELPRFLQDIFWPKILGEGGVLGFAFYATFFVAILTPLFRIRSKTRGRGDMLQAFCIANFILVFAISTASAPLTNELLLFVTGVSLGYGMGGVRTGGQSSRQTSARARRTEPLRTPDTSGDITGEGGVRPS